MGQAVAHHRMAARRLFPWMAGLVEKISRQGNSLIFLKSKPRLGFWTSTVFQLRIRIRYLSKFEEWFPSVWELDYYSIPNFYCDSHLLENWITVIFQVIMVIFQFTNHLCFLSLNFFTYMNALVCSYLLIGVVLSINTGILQGEWIDVGTASVRPRGRVLSSTDVSFLGPWTGWAGPVG